jgi:hypothetical protein
VWSALLNCACCNRIGFRLHEDKDKEEVDDDSGRDSGGDGTAAKQYDSDTLAQ